MDTSRSGGLGETLYKLGMAENRNQRRNMVCEAKVTSGVRESYLEISRNNILLKFVTPNSKQVFCVISFLFQLKNNGWRYILKMLIMFKICR